MSVFSVKNFMGVYATPVLATAFLLPGNNFAHAADISSKPYFPPAPQQAAPMPLKPYRGICSSFLVRSAAKQRFAQQIRNVPHEPQLYIKAFGNIEEVQYQKGPESYNIGRHYCTAAVIMNNGKSYPAIYNVARNQGFAALGGLHVSFCVIDFNNWLVRDNDCRSLRAPIHSVY